MLLALVTTLAGFSSCSKDSTEAEENGGVVKNASFKITLHATTSTPQTRGANPSNSDGWKGADEREYAVSNATLFFYQSKQGVNAAANTPILFKVYFPSFTKNTTASTSPTDVSYTSEVVKTKQMVNAGEYHVIAVVNNGYVGDEANTLGELQAMTTNHLYYGTGTDVASCSGFVMTSSDDTPVTINATPNMADNPNGALSNLSLNVERLAARIDYSPGKGTWQVDKTIPTTSGDITKNCYEYVVVDDQDKVTNDRFYLTSVTPINLSNNTEYMLKRVSTDRTLTNGVTYLGAEQIGADKNASNYVIDPYTTVKTSGTNDVLLSYLNPYTTWIDDFNANNTNYPVSQTADGLENCYTDNSLVYRKLCYAQENTIPVGANKQKYVTGLIFTGYYLKEGASQAIEKTYVYYIRHTDPSGSASDALLMKYGIVRNSLYQVNVSKVTSLGVIVLEVRDWVPSVAPDIDL